jgi:integrase
VIRAAGIRTSQGRAPRIHDLRFTFAAQALLRWYRAGVDVQTRLPALATYLGHASVVSTQYYLTFLAATAEAASERFHTHSAAWLTPSAWEGGRL